MTHLCRHGRVVLKDKPCPDCARRPLAVLSPELRQKLLEELGQELDEHDSPIPKGLTPEERRAALDPGLPGPKETPMDVTPGWKTSEYWLKLLVVLVVLPVLVFFGGDKSPLPEMMDALKGAGPFAALIALVLGKVVPLGIAWLAARLAEKYGAGRVELKVAALQLAARAKG